MKRNTMIPILLVLVVLSSCAKKDVPNSTRPTSAGSPPMFPSINLHTYEELARFVIPEEAKVRSTNIYDNYKTALSKMIEEGIPIPCKGGEPVHLYYTYGDNSRITVQPLGSYSRIQYYTTSNKEQIWIRVFLEWDISSTFTDEDSGSDIQCTLTPGAANLHNAQEYTEDYSYIGERVITTSNGEKNTLYKASTKNREYFTFMQNGFVVELAAKPDVLTAEWFEDLSIELMPVSNVATTE